MTDPDGSGTLDFRNSQAVQVGDRNIQNVTYNAGLAASGNDAAKGLVDDRGVLFSEPAGVFDIVGDQRRRDAEPDLGGDMQLRGCR